MSRLTRQLQPSARPRVSDRPTTVPKASQLLWVMLRALSEIGGSGSIQEIEIKAMDTGGFTREQQTVVHKDGPQSEISYQLAWARTILKAAGALNNQQGRGIWALTEEGRTLTEVDMPEVLARGRMMLRSASTSTRTGPGENEDAISPEVIPADNWRERLLRVLLRMPASAFERLCQRLLRESGFLSVQITGRSGDGGIDGIGVLRINLLSFPVLFQCKRYAGNVSASTVRDFRGAMMGRTDKGLLITTGGFTADARREATRDGAPPIDLIDGSQLCDILKNLTLGVSTRLVEEVDVDPGWFAAI